VNKLTLTYIVFGETMHVLGCKTDRVRDLRPIGCFEPDWPAVEAARARVQAQMHHAADSGEVSGAVLEEVQSLCGFLFDELVPLEAKRWLRDGEGSLRLSLPPELLRLPWELLHTGRDFLSLAWSMGRVVQLERDAEPSRSLRGNTRRVLLVADPDGELHESYDEGLTLRAQLRGSDRTRVTFRGGDVDAALLRRQARGHDIIHYAGHIDDAGWRMADSRFDRAAIERLSGGAPLPALIFANGCGGATAPTFSDSMLEAWLGGGTRHVLGPLFDLPDRLGRLFAEQFYEALLSGASVGEASRTARRALAASVGRGATPWGAYALYGNPDEVYFGRRKGRAKQVTSNELTGPTRLRAVPSPEVVRRQTQVFPRDERHPAQPFDKVFLLVLVGMLLAALAALSASGGAGFGDWGAAVEAPVPFDG
jgi:hypothetical protein